MASAHDPMSSASQRGRQPARIASRTTVGAVYLSVSNLERSSNFYRRDVGLEILDQGAGRASLGVGDRELVVLFEESGARPAEGFTGLYHFALLLPRRVDLARWLSHAARDRIPLVGLSDHFVSEALYLSDPDGHGIEIYWDRPREVWEGQVASRMTTLPLDVDDLLAELADSGPEPFEGLSPRTVMGHVHLKVATIPETIDFSDRCSASRLRRGSAPEPRSSAPADITTMSAPTRGRARAPHRPRPGQRGSVTSARSTRPLPRLRCQAAGYPTERGRRPKTGATRRPIG